MRIISIADKKYRMEVAEFLGPAGGYVSKLWLMNGERPVRLERIHYGVTHHIAEQKMEREVQQIVQQQLLYGL